MKKPTHDRRRRTGPTGTPRRSEDETTRPDAMQTDLALAEAELGDNELADVVVRLIERVRPYSSTILAGLAAAVAVLVVAALVSSQSEATRRQSWDACLSAISSGESDAFNEVIRRYPGTDAARWAELLVADAAAAEGAELLFRDRKRAENRLQLAVDAYSSLMASRPRGLLAERAVFGLAKARESLGQLAEARRGYEAVAAEYPDDPLARLAGTRAAELGREATAQWYDWFASQNTAPPAAAPNAAAPESPAPPQPAE